MTLTSLWLGERDQFEGKKIHQIIGFAGEGRLRDENKASIEFREFLNVVPSSLLIQYKNDCLQENFEDSGFVLQDIVNQIGLRLGFNVRNGRYRGSKVHPGYDGLWEFSDGHLVIIEVKTTDAYQINLDTIAGYRRFLIEQSETNEESSSILIVLAKEKKGTSDLEAQIRGSRFAWNIRLVSINALLRLLSLKENVENPGIIKQISQILIPREFTKLDEIIDMVFATVTDVKDQIPIEDVDLNSPLDNPSREFEPSTFHNACVSRIEKKLGLPLVKRSKTTYSSPDEIMRISCVVSKDYGNATQKHYWFGLHPYQMNFLSATEKAFVTFGCGKDDVIFFIPFLQFQNWLPQLSITQTDKRMYWHVHIFSDNNEFFIRPKQGFDRIFINDYLLK